MQSIRIYVVLLIWILRTWKGNQIKCELCSAWKRFFMKNSIRGQHLTTEYLGSNLMLVSEFIWNVSTSTKLRSSLIIINSSTYSAPLPEIEKTFSISSWNIFRFSFELSNWANLSIIFDLTNVFCTQTMGITTNYVRVSTKNFILSPRLSHSFPRSN